jgi:hypothetical protein
VGTWALSLARLTWSYLYVPKSGRANRNTVGWRRPQVARPSRTMTNYCDRNSSRGIRGMPPTFDFCPVPSCHERAGRC